MKNQHVHKYQRIKFKKDGVEFMKCMLPGCTSYKRKELCNGDLCQCWICSETFQLSTISLVMRRPHCKSCTEKLGERNRQFRELRELVPQELDQ